MNLKKKLLLFFLFCLIFSFSFAQNLATIKGRVLDVKLNFPIPSATVVLQGTNKGVITDDDGYFTIYDVEPKSYNIEAQYLGYKTQVKYNVIVKTAGNSSIIFELEEEENVLDAVIVQESPFKRSKETPLSVQTFSAVEIATYPAGNNDVTKVAQSFPGVSPSVGGGGFRNDLIIRGGAPNETVYYLDEIEIPNINHFSTQGSGGGPVGMINVSFIDEVSFSTSAFNAQYDNPLSGVLRFDQRNGDNKTLKSNFRVSASEAGLTLESPLFKGDREYSNTTFIGSVRRSYLQFLFEAIGLPIRPDYWDYQFKLNHVFDEFNTISLIGLGSIDDFTVKAPDDFDFAQQAVLEQVPIIEQNTNTFGITWKKKYKNLKGQTKFSLSRNQLNNELNRYSDNENKEGVVFSNNSKETETKFRINSFYYFGDVKLSWGGNFQNSQYTNLTDNKITSNKYETNVEFLKYGLFAQASGAIFSNKLTYSVGVRADDDTFLNNSSLLKTIAPRLSLSYRLDKTEKWLLNASVGYYYKLLPYTILGFQNQTGFANKDSDYTQSRHIVLGIERKISQSARITIEGFHKQYNQFPISVRDGVSLANKGADFGVLGNELISTSGEGRAYGIEFLYDQKLNKNLYAVFAYTYFKSEFTGLDGNYLPSVWDSRHLASFTGGYKLPKNWEISMRYRFAGETPYVPINEDLSLQNYPNVIPDYSRLGTVNLPVFGQGDLRIDKKWNLKKVAINIFFEAQNFLIQQTPQAPDYGLNRTEEGMLIMPSTLVQIKDTSPPALIPNLGIVIDF